MKAIFRRKSFASIHAEASSTPLKRSLGVFELTMMGIGAIIGTGIFVLTGEAAAGTEHALGAGPALTISFLVTGLACAFAALCYAEFASMVPISGSAYTYSYASFGELVAWIIGWDLVLEYAVGNVAVAIGWAGYFKSLLDGFGVHLPGWMCGPSGTEMVQLPSGAWTALTDTVRNDFAGILDQLPHTTAILNLPAFLITVAVTLLLILGISESARVNAILVVIKIALIGLFVAFGISHFNPSEHWANFAPNGFHGIITGAALVFFAYVGFDAVSTTAEEAKNPQRDLPRGMIYSLIICTVLYIVVAALLTGMVPLDVLGNEKPVAAALNRVGEPNIALIISAGVTITMPTVLLVMQLGQIRVFYSMSRDGLLGKRFSTIHKRFQTPVYATVLVGLFVGLLSATIDIGAAAELTNIGTLFAFILVAIGIWILRKKDPDVPRKFKVPFYQIICTLCIVCCGTLMIALPGMTWLRFVIWMAAGLVIYFLYSKHHSNLNPNKKVK